MRVRVWLGALTVVAAVCVAARVTSGQGSSARAFAEATDAWDDGDYVAAVRGYLDILRAPDATDHFERIALQTGELYVTRELTADGRAPQFSPDGRFISYETGLEVSRATRVVRNDAAFTPVAELPGISATFSRLGDRVAYLKLGDDPELKAALRALEATPLAAPNRAQVVRDAAWQTLAHTSIAIHDLATGQEHEVAAPGLMKSELAFGSDGATLYFLGATSGDDIRDDIFVLRDGASAPAIAVDVGGFKGALTVALRRDPTTPDLLMYQGLAMNPFRRPGGPASRPIASFAIADMGTGKVSAFVGTSAVLSADGTAFAYIERTGGQSSLLFGSPFGTQHLLKQTTGRLDAPAISADGSQVAYQMMERDDWDIYTMRADGTDEHRVTNEIQHDVLPRFLGPNRLLAAIGEPRHRRSFIYENGRRVRLFHNNTIRTIAPEYQWVPSGDGRQILIVAERDGNTVSPERGVYLVDLQRRISSATLVARLEADLASETALRAKGSQMFEPLAAEVRDVLAKESVNRIYGYESSLFGFGSKNIRQPGNAQAREYLVSAFRSFGYEPELQWFETSGSTSVRTANVVATLKGTTNPDLVYVISSHYDTVFAGPGADDDASGIAALLEAARVLADHPMPATIEFAAFTGEEAGLLGSREFVRRAVADGVHVVGALNNDMVGWANDQHLDNTIRYSNPGIRDVQHAAAFLFTKLVTYDSLYFKGTDAASYYDAYGDIVGGIGSYPVLGTPHYHQPHDLLEYENHEQIAETSKATVATIMLLASSPSRVTGLAAAMSGAGGADVTWTASPEVGIAGYRVARGPSSSPLDTVMTVKGTRASVGGVEPGTVVSVKAVNARGLEGWDWARVTIR